MANLSIAQIAARLGVSERTARRWIESGRMDAEPGRRRGHYHVDLDQLEQLARYEPDELTALRSEVALLARRVEELERQVSEIPATTGTHRRPATTGKTTIPELEPGLVGAKEFAIQHGINEGTAKSAWQSRRVTARYGKWRGTGRNPILVALDRQGRAELWELYHDKDFFIPCQFCPHDREPDMPTA